MLDIKPEINVNISGKMGGKLTREVYKDAAKPFAKEFGKTGALAGKTINMLLSPLAATVWGYEKIKEVLQKKSYPRSSPKYLRQNFKRQKPISLSPSSKL